MRCCLKVEACGLAFINCMQQCFEVLDCEAQQGGELWSTEQHKNSRHCDHCGTSRPMKLRGTADSQLTQGVSLPVRDVPLLTGQGTDHISKG